MEEESCEPSLGAAVRLIINGTGHIGTINRLGARGILAQPVTVESQPLKLELHELGHSWEMLTSVDLKVRARRGSLLAYHPPDHAPRRWILFSPLAGLVPGRQRRRGG